MKELIVNNLETSKLNKELNKIQESELKMAEYLKLVEQLEKECDEKFKPFFEQKEADSFDISKYEEFRRLWVLDQLEREGELMELRAFLEKVSAEKNSMSRDSVSGLYRREFLFKKMDKKLREIFVIGENEEPKQILDKILTKKLGQEKDMIVVMSDMSFLSLANERAHEEGDELIAKVGKAWHEEGRSVFRHGGDEITDLVDGEDVKDYQLKLISLRDRVKNIKIGIFEKYGIKPNIDIGQASLSEVHFLFKNICEDANYKNIALRNPLKEFESLWVQIADKRAAIEKGIERILFLVKKYKEQEKHDNYYSVINFARKGGYNISDQKVADLSKIENEVELMEKVREIVIDYEDKQLAGQREEVDLGDYFSMYKYVKAKMIYDLVMKDYRHIKTMPSH